MTRSRAAAPALALALLAAGCVSGGEVVPAVPSPSPTPTPIAERCVDLSGAVGDADLAALGGGDFVVVMTRGGETIRVPLPTSDGGPDIQPALGRTLDGWTAVRLCGRSAS